MSRPLDPAEFGLTPNDLEALSAFQSSVVDLAGQDMPSGHFGLACLDLSIQAFRGSGVGRRRYLELVRRVWAMATDDGGEQSPPAVGEETT